MCSTPKPMEMITFKLGEVFQFATLWSPNQGGVDLGGVAAVWPDAHIQVRQVLDKRLAPDLRVVEPRAEQQRHGAARADRVQIEPLCGSIYARESVPPY